MTQEEKVLVHMRLHGRITSYEAFEHHRITRLAAVIHRLREQGHEIETIIRTHDDNGHKVQWAEYRLK